MEGEEGINLAGHWTSLGQLYPETMLCTSVIVYNLEKWKLKSKKKKNPKL